MIMADQDCNAANSLASESKQIACCEVMNTQKYFHRRVPKRKKYVEKCAIENNTSSVEEERQFKLKRFVKDVDQFVKEKELTSQKKEAHNLRSQAKTKSKPAMPLVKRGLFQNGVQTQFFSRGALGREMTARLDENLHQIIALASKENVCPCVHHCQQPPHCPTLPSVRKSHREPLKPCNLRVSPSPKNWQRTPSPPSVSVSCRETGPDRQQPLPQFDDLDRKLYLEVTRTVTNSCIESMSKQFKNKSYLTVVKRKLLDIYLQGKKKNSQHSCCTSEAHSSRAVSQSVENNSPLTQGQLSSATPHTQTTQDSEQSFKELNFISQPKKSTKKFLEETLGPGPRWDAVSPEIQQYHPPPSHPIRRNTVFHCPDASTGSKYFHPKSISSTYNTSTEAPTWNAVHVSSELQQYHLPPSSPIRRNTKCHCSDVSTGPKLHQSKADDLWNEWTNLRSNNLNSFLPPVEEDSPEFQYFPRRMF